MYVEQHTIYIYTIYVMELLTEKYQIKTGSWFIYANITTRVLIGVHGKYGKELNLKLKRDCQRKYEEKHTREDFIKLIGRSYL